MSRLRVGVDVTALIGPPTGIHQVTRALVDELVRHVDIDLSGWILSARGAAPPLPFPVHRGRVPAGLALRTWERSGFPPTRLVAGAVDVVHGTNFLAPPSPTSVITLQDTTPLTRPEWCEPAVAAMAGPVHRAVAKGAMVHVSSNLVREEALELFDLSDDRVRLVHHAVAPLTGGSADHGRRLAGSDRYLLALGRTEKRKNIPAAVSALAAVEPDVRLVVAGPPGNDDDAVTAAIARLGAGRVVRLPAVSDHDRAALVAGAEALLWPSRYEGFALPPLEALAAGTPVVATAVGALPELIGDTIDLVAPGDDDAFGEAVSATRGAVVPAGLAERILAHTWADVATEMVAIYESVAGR